MSPYQIISALLSIVGHLLLGIGTLISMLMIPLGIIGVVAFLMIRARTNRRKRADDVFAVDQAEMARRKALLDRYTEWTSFLSPYDSNFIALNTMKKRLAIGDLTAVREHPFSDVVAVEAKADNATVTKHDQTYTPPFLMNMQYTRELSLLNAIQSPTTSINTIRQLSLIVTIDDNENPTTEVQFFYSDNEAGVDPRNSDFVSMAQQADQIHGLLLIALHDQKSGSKDSHDETDQLKEFWDLKESGAITESEFEAEKAKLLKAN